jgi:hypothetical protein
VKLISNNCVFCERESDRMHHIIPRCKGGDKTVPSCFTCESYIHSQWSHNELRDTYNNVEVILKNESFQKFLKWRCKQRTDVVFHSQPGKYRKRGKYQ